MWCCRELSSAYCRRWLGNLFQVKDNSRVSVIAITMLLKSGREEVTTSFSPLEILFCVAACTC